MKINSGIGWDGKENYNLTQIGLIMAPWWKIEQEKTFIYEKFYTYVVQADHRFVYSYLS